MNAEHPVVIVGGGIAGLCCALRLIERGVACAVFEASDGVGGRVRTDVVEGFRLDRGFQVFLTAYPECRRVLDYLSLDLRPFDAGAKIWHGGVLHGLYDPRRHPSAAFKTIMSGLLTTADKVRMLKLWNDVRGVDPDALLQTGSEQSTEAELRSRDFSDEAIGAVLRPFFGGVLLQRPMTTSSRFFRYTFRMFADGRAAVPAAGIEAIPGQLAARVRTAGVSIRLNARVTKVEPGSVTTDDGQVTAACAVVVATQLPESVVLLPRVKPSPGPDRSACTAYFAADTAAVRSATLVLNGSGSGDGPVNHLAEMSAAAPTYAPPGKTLIAASVLDADAADDPILLPKILDQLRRWFGPGVDKWWHLRTYRVPHALPPLDAPAMHQWQRPVVVAPGLFVCGDHRDQPSINGAMVSGRRAADAVAEGLE